MNDLREVRKEQFRDQIFYDIQDCKINSYVLYFLIDIGEWFWDVKTVLIMRPERHFFTFLPIHQKMIIDKLILKSRYLLKRDLYDLIKIHKKLLIEIMNFQVVEDPEIIWPSKKKIMKIVEYIESIKETLSDNNYKISLEYLSSFLKD